jgi:hypothetical protein
MKIKHLIRMATLLSLVSSTLTAARLGTAFTYQGPLTGGGAPANGNYELQFMLFEAASGGAAVSGLALGAIQGLNQKLEEKNAALQKEVAELKALVEALAEKVNGGGQ